MTLDQIKTQLDEIRACAPGDEEAAHAREDDLHQDVLRAIRDGVCESPKEAAALALTSPDIEFPRYCA